MCIKTPFVPPRRLIAAVREAVTITPKHSLPPLLLIRSYGTDHLAIEGGDPSLTATVQRSSIVTVLFYTQFFYNRFQLHIPLPQQLTVSAPT